ncbi:MAG: UDP-3-O-acyl-N-acetylglucosamine deacetylase [Alphaproteobacteria bacterium]
MGLHTGSKTSMRLNPAPINTGYVFRLEKNGKLYQIKASYKNVRSTKLCTLISDSQGKFNLYNRAHSFCSIRF